MSLGTISLTEGDGDKSLATSSVIQGATTVEVQRVALEGYASAGPATYLVTSTPTSPTGAGVLVSVENGGASSKNVYLARVEVVQTSAASAGTLATVRIGRGAANGTGGTAETPIAADPDGPTAGASVRRSTNATPNTGITAPTGTAIYAAKEIHLGNTISTLSTITFDFANPGQLLSVPFNSTEPITIAISGTAATADLRFNLVLIEHEV